MSGDRALDKMIDEQVFGYEVFDHASGPYRVGGYGDGGRVPNYSNDIAAAMLVASHMREQGYWLQVQDERRYSLDRWEVEFVSVGRDASVVDTSLPRAICEAALAATRGAAAGDGEADE